MQEAGFMTEIDGRAGHPALTDSQTGLPNKLHWDTVFGVIFAAADRGIPLTLILLEIDQYQEWNLGHDPEEADRVFAALGETLGMAVRQSDLAARTQEGRFAFLLMDCNLAGGRLVADRLDAILDPVRNRSGLGFSMGVAAHARSMARPEDLVGAAETALTAAQGRGKNQIEFFG
jgi:diguanylate cyclase (GGDEF)-like protein